MKSLPIKTALLVTVLSLFSQNLSATDYHVGPDQSYTELGDLPWLTLQPGDRVLIHWRNEPYAEKIFVRVSGTSEAPIIIRGVPDANGNLPVITGENATTNSQFVGYFSSQWTEDLGLFLIHRNNNVEPYDDSSYKPSHIIFEYLELTGAKPGNFFYDQFGNQRNYNSFSSAIHALESNNLTVRHCKIYDNAQGIFTNSNGNTEGQISRNTLIEYNEIWGNGNADSDGTEHNVYIQSAGTIIQYNRFGSLRPGSVGANIKDRSAGTIIRYNWIEGSARLLDLVETEDAQEIMMNEPDYHDVYVYGNIFVNDMTKSPFGTNMIHFGHDNSPVEAKRGTLYFYNNTVYIKGNLDNSWYVRLFDIYDDGNASTTEASIALYNNIIHRDGTTHLQLMRDAGTLEFFANNWITEDYEELGYGATAQVVYHTQPITGTEPGFIDALGEDFTLTGTSQAVDQSGSFPENITTNYPLDQEYVKHADVIARPVQGNAMDLGAFESSSTGNSAPSVPQNLASSDQTSSTITLIWDASIGTVTGYKVYRDGTEIGTAGDTTYTDTGLMAATAYTYRVSALNGNAESAQSNPLTVSTDSASIPSVPENLTVTHQTPTTVSLSWSASSGTVTGYKLYRDGFERATVNDTVYTDTGLAPETTYFYTVSAYNSSSESEQSEPVTATTTSGEGGSDPVFGPLNPPVTNISEVLPAPGSVGVNTTQLQIRFTAEYSNEWSAGEYVRVYRASDNTLIESIDVGSLPLVSYTDDLMTLPLSQTLEANITYYVVMDENTVYVNQGPSWKNGAINPGDWSFTVGDDSSAAPSVPDGLSVTGQTSTTISLSWIASAGNITGYKVYRNGAVVATVSETAYTDTGLAPETTYSYTVSALNNNNESAQSGAVSAMTTVVPTPEGLSVTDQTSTTVSLSWNAISEPATGYKVYREGIEIIVVSETIYTDTGLAPETTYSYTVSALNGDSESEQSDPLIVTTFPNSVDPVFGPLTPPVDNIDSVSPAPGSSGVNVTELRIRFSAEYSNEWSGGEYIYIYRSSDNTAVEVVDLGTLPLVSYTTDLMIIPLSQPLSPNTDYYVTLNSNVIHVNQGPTWKNGAINPGVWGFTTSGYQNNAARYSDMLNRNISDQIENGMAIWPNPFNQQLNIKTLGKAGDEIFVRLFDANGRMCLSRNFVLVNENETKTLGNLTRELRDGIYHLQIIAKDRIIGKATLLKR